MVTVKPPGEVSTPQRLQSVRYQRPDAHLKHLATGQSYYSRLARRNGFDDALLTGDEGVVSESAIANIGFFDDFGVVWPDAPNLHGITMRLLEGELPKQGVQSRLRWSDFGTSRPSRERSSRTRAVSRSSARSTTSWSRCTMSGSRRSPLPTQQWPGTPSSQLGVPTRIAAARTRRRLPRRPRSCPASPDGRSARTSGRLSPSPGGMRRSRP